MRPALGSGVGGECEGEAKERKGFVGEGRYGGKSEDKDDYMRARV